MLGCSNHAFFSLVADVHFLRSVSLFVESGSRRHLPQRLVGSTKLYSVWKQPKLGVVISKYLRPGCADITIEDVEKKRHRDQGMLGSDQALDQRLYSQKRFSEVRR